MKKSLMFIVVSIIVVAGIISPLNFQVVNAAQQRTLMFPVKGRWYICQGYNTSVSHYGEDKYGFDLSPDKNSIAGALACNPNTRTAATGKKVYAPADGTISYYRYPDIIDIRLTSGGCMKIAHFSSTVIPGKGQTKVVKQDAYIGTLAGPNTANGNYAHLHLSVYSDKTTCRYSPVAFDEKSNFRLYGASNFPATTIKQAYRGKSITQIWPPVKPTPTKTAVITSTTTLAFTPTITATFTETPTPSSTLLTNTPTATQTFTATPTVTLTPTPSPITVQPESSQHPTYPDACVSSNQWVQIPGGFGWKAYLTLNLTGTTTPAHYVRWVPKVPSTGKYKVEIYIPWHTSPIAICGKSYSTQTATAKYQIWYRGSDGATTKTTINVNQSTLSGDWKALGNFSFTAGDATQYIKLADITDEASKTRLISFGAIRFTYISP